MVTRWTSFSGCSVWFLAGDALAGAGEAAFRLGDYALARTYLRQVPTDVSAARNTRELVELVLSHDPLANRLGSAERRRRLATDLSYAQQRLSTCLEQRPAGSRPTANWPCSVRPETSRRR